MLTNFILLFLFSGVPYYLYFEKSKKLQYEKIFFLSSFLLILGMILLAITQQEISIFTIVVVFISSLFSLYKANKTSNFYKLIYYILFFNSPMLFIFGAKESIYYGISLLLTLFGLYLIGRYYERNYGSANYQSVSGITQVTPYAGFFLTVYLTTLALYPPFPNSILFFNAILSSDTSLMWYLIVIVIFFGNFLIAMRVMAKTVFGKPNPHVHYIEITTKEKWIHIAIFIILLLLSAVGLKEITS